MKTIAIFRLVAMIFVFVTAILLILMVLDVITSQETRDTVIKLASVSGIIAATAIAISFLSHSKS